MTRRRIFQDLAASLVVRVTGIAPGRPNHPQAEQVVIAGRDIPVAQPPAALTHDADAGLLIARPGRAQRIHARQAPYDWCGESRCAITPAGDYLLMFKAGGHYGGKSEKVNDIVAYRSSEMAARPGLGPPFHGGFLTTSTALCRCSRVEPGACTRSVPSRYLTASRIAKTPKSVIDHPTTTAGPGRTRRSSSPPIIPIILACSSCGCAKQIAEPGCSRRTPAGRATRVTPRPYVMRSTNRSRDWTLLPGARPDGWTEPKYARMEEGRPINLGNGKVLLITRTAEGRLWQLVRDDGANWSDPEPTPLVHPLAPPMVLHLSDGKIIAAFHHNRYTGGESNSPSGADRSELWVSLSSDGAKTWSEPGFVLANANQPYGHAAFAQSVSYIDAVAGKGVLHIFISHQFRQVVHVRFPEGSLAKLPSKQEFT